MKLCTGTAGNSPRFPFFQARGSWDGTRTYLEVCRYLRLTWKALKRKTYLALNDCHKVALIIFLEEFVGLTSWSELGTSAAITSAWHRMSPTAAFDGSVYGRFS